MSHRTIIKYMARLLDLIYLIPSSRFLGMEHESHYLCLCRHRGPWILSASQPVTKNDIIAQQCRAYEIDYANLKNFQLCLYPFPQYL